MKPAQNMSNHAQIVPIFHYGLFSLVLAINVLAYIHMYNAIKADESIVLSAALALIGFCLLMSLFIYRGFALKAQDRAIRAEENLRHFVLTGKLISDKLTISQIIALRFSSDHEFVQLAERAEKEQLTNKEIKMAIQSWKGDYYRV